MAEVLVFVDHVDGAVRKPTLELLTLARRIGEPVAVVFGSAADLTDVLGEYGATAVLSVSDPAIEEYLVAPKAEALAQIVGERSPAAVLITSSAEGKEIAGRLAVKLGSGLITDATDVSADGSTTQSVFAGNWTVGASVTHGVPVIIVQDGVAMDSVMRRERMSIDDLKAAARQQGFETLAAIRLAVLEANGQVSFFTSDAGRSGAEEKPATG